MFTFITEYSADISFLKKDSNLLPLLRTIVLHLFLIFSHSLKVSLPSLLFPLYLLIVSKCYIPWMAWFTQLTWVWTNSKRQWRTEKPGMLQPRVTKSWTQLSNWTTTKYLDYSIFAFLWDWNKNVHFQSFDHCWVFKMCWHTECSTLTASSFRIWNSLAGISSCSSWI